MTSQMLIAVDDLGYASNTSSVYRSDPFFANAMLLADSVRATASRFREDVQRTLSLYTQALRMNMTTQNQADHCIVALPQAGAAALPTVDEPNQVIDLAQCRRLFGDNAGVGQFLVSVLGTHADQLGGTLPEDAFTAADVVGVAQQSAATAVSAINATQVAATKAYQFEAARVAAKHGSDHPVTVALRTQGEAGAQTNRVLAASAEAVGVSAPETPARGATLSGRFINERGQGLADYSVELTRANGTRLETVGLTDASGFFSAAYDEKQTAVLNKEGDLFARVVDLAGKEVLRDKTALRFTPDAALQVTLTVPVRVVPKSVAIDGTVIYGGRTPPSPDTPPAPPTPGTPPTPPTPGTPPTPPTPQPPTEPTEPPSPPRARTSLDRLDIDDQTRKRLMEGGVADVEAIVESDPAKLAEIVGDRDTANRLIAMAKQVLEKTPPATPGGTRPRKTPAKKSR
jgi:hypothetical protein